MSLVELMWRRTRVRNEIAFLVSEADRGGYGPQSEVALAEYRRELAELDEAIRGEDELTRTALRGSR